jgi:peptide/nickel transport system substrate-binding protein
MKKNAILCLFSLLVISACNDKKVKIDPDNNVILRQENEPARLNPIMGTQAYESEISDMANMYLMSYDENNVLLPALVKAEPTRKVNADVSLSLGFEMLDEAVWDDGSPVTGNDYLFTIKAIMNPLVDAAAFRSYVGDIIKIEVDEANPKKFTVTVLENSVFAVATVTNAAPILQKSLMDPQGWMDAVQLSELSDPAKAEALANSNPNLKKMADAFNSDDYNRNPKYINGCGEYEIKSWEAGKKIVIQKKQNWWGNKFPEWNSFPNTITYLPIPDPAATLAALKNQEIDAMTRIPAPDFLNLKKDQSFLKNFTLFNSSAGIYYFIALNSKRSHLADKKVRQAIAHAVDVQEIIDQVYGGFGTRIVNPLNPSYPEYNKGLKPVPFNLEKSKTLLKEAGWIDSNNNGIVDKVIDGKKTELDVKYLFNSAKETSNTMALLLQSNAKKAGINLQLTGMDPQQVMAQWVAKDYDMLSAGRSMGAIWNPKQHYYAGSEESDNRTGFGNVETNALIDKIMVTWDKTARDKLYHKLQVILQDEVSEIMLFTPNDCVAISNKYDTKPIPNPPGYNVGDFKLKKVEK